MAKKKASAATTTGANGQKYRKETKEERKARLKQQEEAREVSVSWVPKDVALVTTSIAHLLQGLL